MIFAVRVVFNGGGLPGKYAFKIWRKKEILFFSLTLKSHHQNFVSYYSKVAMDTGKPGVH